MSLWIPQATLIALLLGSVRAAAWLAVCPPFNSRGIPGPVKALLAVGIALPVTPGLARSVPASIATPTLVLDLVEQVVIGAAFGFCTQLFIVAVQAAGSFIDLFGGFAMAFAFDPIAATGNAVFGRFYNLMATTLLFATGGHQVVLAGFARSYRAIPVSGALSLSTLQRLLTGGIGDMFLAAVQIAGPLIAVLFLADIALGLLSRVAPALNAFGLGFPAKILLTLTIAGTALALLPGTVASLTDRAVQTVLALLDGS